MDKLPSSLCQTGGRALLVAGFGVITNNDLDPFKPCLETVSRLRSFGRSSGDERDSVNGRAPCLLGCANVPVPPKPKSVTQSSGGGGGGGGGSGGGGGGGGSRGTDGCEGASSFDNTGGVSGGGGGGAADHLITTDFTAAGSKARRPACTSGREQLLFASTGLEICGRDTLKIAGGWFG